MSGFGRKIAIGTIAAIIGASVLGFYVTHYFPVQNTLVKAPSSVQSNRMIVMAQVPVQYLGAGSGQHKTFAFGIWEMRLKNNLNTPLNLVTSLNHDEVSLVYNSTSLNPGQSLNITACVS